MTLREYIRNELYVHPQRSRWVLFLDRATPKIFLQVLDDLKAHGISEHIIDKICENIYEVEEHTEFVKQSVKKHVDNKFV